MSDARKKEHLIFVNLDKTLIAISRLTFEHNCVLLRSIIARIVVRMHSNI